MTDVWYTLIALAGLLFIGGIATIAWHALVDWREGRRWPAEVEAEWDDNDTEVHAAFFEPEQPAVDPWTDIETWTTTQLQEAQDQLDVIRLWARAGFDEIPTPAPLVEEEALPAMLFDDLTAKWRQVNPRVAGHTETWMLPSPDIDQAIADPYQRWNGFTPALDDHAFVPAQRAGGGS